MKIPPPIHSTIITNRTKFIVFVAVFITGGTALAGLLFYLTQSVLIFVALVFTVCLFPVLFERTFRKRFSQNVVVVFSQDGFIVEYDADENNNQQKTDIIQLENVKLFKPGESNKNDFSTLKIVFKDGSKLDYTFSGQKNDNVTETDINFMFKKIIATYNSTKEPEDRIRIIPSFFATQTALYLGLALTLVMAAVTIYYGIKKPATFILSIGFIAIYLQMSLLRKKAIKEKNMFG